MYLGLYEPHQYTSNGGFLEFLMRLSNEKTRPIDQCVPSLSSFISVARDHLDKVSSSNHFFINFFF